MASGQSSSPQHEVTAFGRSLRATGLGRRFEMDKRAPGSQVWLGPVHKVAQKPPGFCSMWPVSVCVCVCVSQGFYSRTNIVAKKQVGEERVYSAYTSTQLFITKGSQDWNSSRSGCRS